MARPRLSTEEKARRGTIEHAREARYQGGGLAVADEPHVPMVQFPPRDYIGIASTYAAAVLSGQQVSSSWVRKACERYARDRTRSTADKAWPFEWQDGHAIEACHFIEHCPHVEGRWESALIVLEPWQVFLVAQLFGWRRRDDPSRRRFTTLYLEVARKAAKSTLMAAIAMYHMLREHEPGAMAVLAASTGQQARVVFSIMQRMIRKSFWLRGHGLEPMANSIIGMDSTAKPINSKASTQDGLNPSCIVLDEAHAQDFELHDVLKSSQGARQNPLLLCPTTAGYDLLSVGYALRRQVSKVLDRVFEADHLLGVIYALDEGDDWRDETTWIKSCPMIGVSPTWDYVRGYCKDAQQAPGIEGEFKVKICSLWAQSASSWLSMTAWDACGDPTLKLKDFAGKRCWIGADLAQMDDTSAVAIVFELKDLIVAFVICYLPEDVVHERERAVPEYRIWREQGLLRLTEGNLTDYNVIEADIRALCKQFEVRSITFDQFGSAQISSNLVADGLPALVEGKSAKTYTAPARELEARVKHRKFRHDGNSLLKWFASNTVVTRRIDDSILPKKESAESPNKIDGIDAILQGIGAMLRDKTRQEPKYSMFILGGKR